MQTQRQLRLEGAGEAGSEKSWGRLEGCEARKEGRREVRGQLIWGEVARVLAKGHGQPLEGLNRKCRI